MTKRKKTLSVLFIPEGEKQTFSLKIRYGVLKILFSMFIVACVIFAAGSFSYWNLTKLSWDYDRLVSRNEKLLKDNAIINEIALKYQSLQATDRRIRNLFGDINFTNSDPANSAGQASAGSGYISPEGRDNLYKLLNPFLLADIMSAYPTLIPVGGEITQAFSPKEALTGRGHFGVDLSAKEGSVISAAGDGVVIFSNWTVDAGNQVIIDHQNGYITVYKHNASLLVQERKFIYQGEPIALLGNSGDSSAPHLHIEIWKNYVPVDPVSIWPKNKWRN